MGAQIDGSDVVVVTILIVSSLLGLVLNLTTTEELLGVGVVVKNDTEGGGHVDDLTVLVDEAVLARISTSVTVNVVECVSGIRLIIVDGVVTVRLSDLTNPWADCHELLTFTSILNLEEVVLWTFVVIDTVLKLTSFTSLLVEFGTTVSFVVKFLVVIVVSGGGIRSP